MNTIIELIKTELRAFEVKKKALIDELRKEFPTMFASLFEQAPQIKTVSWHQYTPYFNDGDECTFRSTHDYCEINEDEGDELDEQSDKIADQIQECLSKIPEDFMQDLFGNHVRVVLHADGRIDVEDYEDHD